jgi:hypothetical protein
MGKKSKLYKIGSNDEETSIYGNFNLSEMKHLANALHSDLEEGGKKDEDRKEKKSLLKRLQKLIED